MSIGTVHLSGAIIVQDNEATIGAVLDNLGSFCDEVVVVDGGSRDRTREIAASRPGVRLYRRPCGENLGEQKNFAFDQCFGDWILVLDSDELLGGRGTRHIRALTRIPGAHWFSFPRYWLVEREGEVRYLAERPYYRDRQVRLFRNEPGFRYETNEKPIHHAFVKKHGFGRPLRHPHIYHYAFLLLDRAARESKVARYRRAEPQSGHLHDMYLWEDSAVSAERVPGGVPPIRATQAPLDPGLHAK